MIFILTLIIIVVSFWEKCWSSFPKYHSTMQYVVICNLFNLIVCHDYHLWELHSHFLSPMATELVNSFLLLPIGTLVYICHYPVGCIRKQILYIVKWVIGSLLVEMLFIHIHVLRFHNGWNFWVDIFFYCMMYSFIRLHYLHPLITYGLSCIVGYLLISIFDVPF